MALIHACCPNNMIIEDDLSSKLNSITELGTFVDNHNPETLISMLDLFLSVFTAGYDYHGISNKH